MLVEALVSFMLFLLASFAIYGLLANSRRAELKAGQTLAATGLARELLEGYRLNGYSALKTGVERGSRSFATSRKDVDGVSTLDYSVEVTEGLGGKYKSIYAVVTWKDGRIDMESYVTP